MSIQNHKIGETGGQRKLPLLRRNLKQARTTVPLLLPRVFQ